MDGFKNTTRMKPMAHDPKAVRAGDRQFGGPLRQTDTQIRAQARKEEGEAVARGNRTPYEPIPPAPKRMKTGGLAAMPKTKC
jgi:hypothetical protein